MLQRVPACTPPDGGWRPGARRVALDFAVVNALAPSNWRATAQEPGGAASVYAERKRTCRSTARQCLGQGIHFLPLVLEAQGGMTREAGAFFHGLGAAVATAEGGDAAAVREEIFARLAILLLRANARALARRRGPLVPCTEDRRAFSAAAALHAD